MDRGAPIEIRKVVNGWYVSPAGPVISGKLEDNIHVFRDMPELQAWLADHFDYHEPPAPVSNSVIDKAMGDQYGDAVVHESYVARAQKLNLPQLESGAVMACQCRKCVELREAFRRRVEMEQVEVTARPYVIGCACSVCAENRTG